jgi:hypothetical protein
LQFKGTDVELRLNSTPSPGSTGVFRVVIQAVPLGGGDAVSIDLGMLRTGDHTYRGPAQVCGPGCRIATIGVTASDPNDSNLTMILEQMRTLTPTAGVVDLGLSEGVRWRPSDVADGGPAPLLTPVAGGLQMTIPAAGTGDLLGASAVNVSGKLPVITTGALDRTTLGLIANQPASVDVVGVASALPRLGNHGALVDLRTYDSESGADTDVSGPEIWLNASAPQDIEAQLRSAGVLITGQRDQTSELSYAKLQGPSVGMRFDTLVGIAALVLAVLSMILMAAIDRRSRAAELRVLRVQGLPAGTARRAAFVGHASIALVAGVIGGFAALVSWLLVSAKLPILASGIGSLDLDVTPPWYALVLPAIAGTAILAVTAAFAAQDVSAVVRRNEERGSAL